jgi:L-2-hydroxycarboxylate dehydrogenase (NAD+)
MLKSIKNKQVRRNNMIHLSVDDLKQFIENAFKKLEVPEEDAKICADILIASDLRGIESHGIGRLRMYVDRIKSGQIENKSTLEILKESPTTAVIDGHHGIGMVIGFRSMNLAIEKAMKLGMGAVAVRNSTHFGIDGYYPLMAIKNGLIGMSFTNARPSVTPTFSTQPKLGTNPIAFGAPTDEEFPFLFDAATSITQRGKIEVLAREEKQAKEGWVVDSEGKPMTDPNSILDGLSQDQAALLPLGGDTEALGSHKGYGLSTVVEILSSSLQSGAFLSALSGLNSDGSAARFKVGHFFMAMSIEAFIPLEVFKKNIGGLLRELRASRKTPGQSQIFTAGEKEFLNEIKVRKTGVPINENLKKDILYVKQLLGITDLTLD